jgi:hypothetical protein
MLDQSIYIYIKTYIEFHAKSAKNHLLQTASIAYTGYFPQLRIKIYFFILMIKNNLLLLCKYHPIINFINKKLILAE